MTHVGEALSLESRRVGRYFFTAAYEASKAKACTLHTGATLLVGMRTLPG